MWGVWLLTAVAVASWAAVLWDESRSDDGLARRMGWRRRYAVLMRWAAVELGLVEDRAGETEDVYPS